MADERITYLLSPDPGFDGKLSKDGEEASWSMRAIKTFLLSIATAVPSTVLQKFPSSQQLECSSNRRIFLAASASAKILETRSHPP